MQPTRNLLFCSQQAVRRAEICFSHSCRLLPRTSFSSLPMPRSYAALQAFMPLLVLLRCAPLVPNLLLADPPDRISASPRADFLLLVRCTTLTPLLSHSLNVGSNGCCFRVTSARRCRAESKPAAAENASRAAFADRKAALIAAIEVAACYPHYARHASIGYCIQLPASGCNDALSAMACPSVPLLLRLRFTPGLLTCELSSAAFSGSRRPSPPRLWLSATGCCLAKTRRNPACDLRAILPVRLGSGCFSLHLTLARRLQQLAGWLVVLFWL